MAFLSCANAAATYQLKLTNCAGATLSGSVPTCTEMNAAIAAAAISAATDTVAGKVALNLGNTAGDDTNAVDALTASGFNALANAATPAGGNEVQKSITNAIEAAIGSDAGAINAIVNAIVANPAALATLAAALAAAIPDAFEA